MTNTYPAQLLALARLALNGARSLAISAGVDTQRFHRVFSDRSPMPADMEVLLGKAIGFEKTGFDDASVRSAICKQISDLDNLRELGFQWSPICQISTARINNGGTSLQRYFVAEVRYGNTFRVLIVRMATIKYLELFSRYEQHQVPTLEVGTKEISFLNEVVLRYDAQTDFDGLKLALSDASHRKLERLIIELKKWLEAGSSRKPREIAQRRPTDILRIAEAEARFIEWDEPTRQMSKTHHLYPVSSQIRSVDAIGLLVDEKPVFVDVVTLKDGQPKRLGPKAKKHCQHMLAFNQTGTDTDPKFSLLYDGPMQLVLEIIGARTTDSQYKDRTAAQSEHPRELEEYVTVKVLQAAKVKLEGIDGGSTLRLKMR